MLEKLYAMLLQSIVMLRVYPVIIKEIFFGKIPVTKFTGVRMENGSRINTLTFYKRFVFGAEPMDLVSDQGNIALIHGTPMGSQSNEGLHLFNSDIKKFFKRDGDYTLISCHNKFHQDFVDDKGRKFTRDKETTTLYPIIGLVGFGVMYFISSREIYKAILEKMYSKDIVEMQLEYLEKQPIHREISEDDLPGDIKKLIEKQREVA